MASGRHRPRERSRRHERLEAEGESGPGALDAIFAFLAAPSVRRVRRWAFVVTVPAAAAFVAFVGLERSVALVVLEVAVLLLLVAVATKVRGERAEVLLDFVLHPAARRALRTELALLWTVPEALLARRRPRPGTPFTYHRGSLELALALALVPVAAIELAVLELVLPASWFWVKVGIALVTAYGVLALVGLGLGLRVHPHRLRDDVLELRVGQLYRADVPLDAIERVSQRRERIGDRTRLLLRGSEALLLVAGRVDVRLELSAPQVVRRPFGEPVQASALALAADDPGALVRSLGPGRPGDRPSD